MKFKILTWHHGTSRNLWKDSGWVYNGKFYPCQYTDNPKGTDKIIGKILIELEEKDRKIALSTECVST